MKYSKILKEFQIPVLASAPIDGYTNFLLRDLFAENSVDIIYSEMYHVNQILNKTPEELGIKKEKYFYIIQLAGNYKSNFKDAILKVQKYCNVIDINAGCPAKNVVKTGAGSALLKEPEKLGKLLKDLSKISDVPISIKLRLGFDKIDIKNILYSILKNFEPVFITIHFRTYKQGFSGKVDFSLYKELKNIFDRIILNGDIKTVHQAREIIDIYKPFGIMIGRAALSDPEIFKKIKEFNLKPIEEKKKIMYLIKLYKNYLNSDFAKQSIKIVELRKIAHSLLKNVRNSHYIKEIINKEVDIKIILKELQKFSLNFN